MWDSIGTKMFVNFCCRTIDFRLTKSNTKSNTKFCQIFGNTKIDFSAKQKFCKLFVHFETLTRFHVSESRQGGAVTFYNCFCAFYESTMSFLSKCFDHLWRLFFSTPTFFFRIFREKSRNRHHENSWKFGENCMKMRFCKSGYPRRAK